MYVPFNQLLENSRIWIYQSNRKLTPNEKQQASTALLAFCDSWTAHQQVLKTSFTIEHDQFIILAADEDYHQPSGCSIDTSVRALKDIQSQLGIDLFNRTRPAFLVDGEVVTYPLADLAALFNAGKLGPETLTFDNLVPSRGDLIHRWKTPVEKTWLVKYLPKSALASEKR